MMKWGIFIVVFLLVACGGKKEKKGIATGCATGVRMVIDTLLADSLLRNEIPADTETEKRMRAMGMVDIQEVDASIRVHLVYATPDNFVGKTLYRDIHKAFMQPETARRLTIAQQRLKALRPDLGLMVYDAARPMSVQQEMWNQVRGTDKRIFVSNPKNGGGLHNYGAAVDLTIADSSGQPLSMGSDFDYFGDEARPDREEAMLRQGRISESDLTNRRLLRRVMTGAGFKVLPTEWWHFNLMSRPEAREKLQVID